jgi:hypothetical protein
VAHDRPDLCVRVRTARRGRVRHDAVHGPRRVPPHRDQRHGARGQGHGGTGGSGKPGSRLPLDLGATARLDAVQGSLTTWARHVAEERSGVGWHATGAGDLVAWAARYLTANLEWMRHRAEVSEFLGDVEACARVVAAIARGPAAQRYLGPCGATVTWDDEGNEVPRDTPCNGDVYAYIDAEKGHCHTCGARWATTARQAWLDGEVRQRAYRASEIEDAYGIKANLIRQWATPERGLLRVHDRDFLGRARYMLGEVLDLAAGQKAKAVARAAERDRRAAAREAAEMGA